MSETGAAASPSGRSKRSSAIARERVRLRIAPEGQKVVGSLGSIREQLAGARARGYLATELEAARQLLGWADRVTASGEGGAYERLIADTYVAEIARQLRGGVDLGQTETISLARDWRRRGRASRARSSLR